MSIDYHSTASFDVDAQCTFTPLCPDELPVAGGDQIVPELNRQAGYASVRLASKDAHTHHALWLADSQHPPLTPMAGHANADCYWPRHAMVGSPGFALLPGLPAVTDYDFFIWKGIEADMHPYGACYHTLDDTSPKRRSTGVIEYLKQQHITTVLVGGLALDYCVKATALQLKNAGFQVIINRSATAGVHPDSTEQAVDALKRAGVLMVRNCAELTVSNTPD